jgi:hypothetical protein
MASRPRLPKTNVEMQRWSASLEEEVIAWPGVTTRPMFGMMAFYRDKTIFAALPRTRAPETPFSLLLKLPKGRHARLHAGGPGQKWVTFALESEADLSEALVWLAQAYDKARVRDEKK